MDFRQIILVSLQIINVYSKKYASSSDESIENLLYFQDCQQKPKAEPPPPPLLLRESPPPPPKAMDCPYPKMCCALTCGGNECGSAPTSMMGRPMQPMPQNFSPIGPLNGPGARQPEGVLPQARNRKKKLKPPMRIQMQPPIVGRRNFGISKDRIKSLINQDDDIRKILKDLVRVAMQKVDLVDKINSHRSAISQPTEVTTSANSLEYDGDEDLE